MPRQITLGRCRSARRNRERVGHFHHRFQMRVDRSKSRVGVGTAVMAVSFGCPYEGAASPDRVFAIAAQFVT
jgi:hypothetical protein